jgi:hypothetical protein
MYQSILDDTTEIIHTYTTLDYLQVTHTKSNIFKQKGEISQSLIANNNS